MQFKNMFLKKNLCVYFYQLNQKFDSKFQVRNDNQDFDVDISDSDNLNLETEEAILNAEKPRKTSANNLKKSREHEEMEMEEEKESLNGQENADKIKKKKSILPLMIRKGMDVMTKSNKENIKPIQKCPIKCPTINQAKRVANKLQEAKSNYQNTSNDKSGQFIQKIEQLKKIKEKYEQCQIFDCYQSRF